MKLSVKAALVMLCLALLALAVPFAVGEGVQAGGEKVLQLGNTEFTLTVDGSYEEGGLTEEDLEENQVGYFYSEKSLLDFDVYQFSKAGVPEELTEFVAEEAAAYDGVWEIVRDAEINGIPITWYRTLETYNGQSYDTITYLLDAGDDYVEIVFWIDGDEARVKADAIIHTLSRRGPVELQLAGSAYSVLIPADYQRGDVTEEEAAAGLVDYYLSDRTLMDFDVYRIEKADPSESLADCVKREAAAYEGVSEVVDSGAINGIPVAWYRAVEAYADTDYNTVTYLMDDGGDIVQILFWLDGDAAEEEAAAIINTLFVPINPEDEDYN